MYKAIITLKSDLCVGSGEASGITVDTDIITDKKGFPYIPARRLKGCLRQAAYDLSAMGCKEATEENIDALFGNRFGTQGSLRIHDAVLPDINAYHSYLDKSIPGVLKRVSSPETITDIYSCVRGMTKMNDGVAEDGTLRYMRVIRKNDPVDPDKNLTFEALISCNGSTEEQEELLKKCCKATRHIGTNRNRGLGYIEIALKPFSGNAIASGKPDIPEQGRVRIDYSVALISPVSIPGYGEDMNEIPARSVIGCVAAQYLSSGKAEDEAFRRLFLNGDCRWSSLTPSIDGEKSYPTPLMLCNLKNLGKMVNRYGNITEEEKKQKLKTLDSTYAVQTDDGYKVLTSVPGSTVYHFSKGIDGITEKGYTSGSGKNLYVQNSIDKNLVFRGTVSVPHDLAAFVISLLSKTEFAFGRSKTAQYAACKLINVTAAGNCLKHKKEIRKGDSVFVVLQADMVVACDGLLTCDHDEIKKYISEKLGLNEYNPEYKDYCLYHTVSGYNTRWQLMKTQVETMRGGSVLAFSSNGNELPNCTEMGEFLQEGFGACRIFCLDEMKKMSTVESGHIESFSAAESFTDSFERILAARIVDGYFTDRARELSREIFELDKGLISRLRMMLSQASDYSEFMEMVSTIKESDKEADKTSRKTKAVTLIRRIYGNNEEIDIDKLFEGDPELLAYLQKNKHTAAVVLGKWKTVLDQLIHIKYYAK